MSSQRMPQFMLDFIRLHGSLSSKLGVPRASTTGQDGLYLGMRSKRDPINTNRKRKYITVRLRRGGVEIFREDVDVKGFPSDHLITQLALLL